ncbi:unnamed protein product [Rotaria sp. Silwood2]|nr:unnamed protein product [Rotaria sp. Silwood2]CAF3028691.1 unnamed protein product [Rotaria sp. Silwood2]CAF4113629.1 unnamed protein product [Rotaria sp. Silwood2]CAF4235952.1 unnamed protein product [Rotaria sp. Silwood2]
MDSNMISEENLEEFTVIWLDSKSYSIDTKARLRCIINFLKVFNNVDDCFNYISSVKSEKVFLITSGLLSETIVSLVHDLPQLRFIYIFCQQKGKYELCSKRYIKIHGIFDDQEALYLMLTQDVKICSNTTSISFFNKNEKSLRHLNGTFYWYQLLRKTLLHMPQTHNAKQDLIDIGRKHYADNDKELMIINDFNEKYKKNEAIRWYTRDSCLYRLLNKAFRTENIDLIFKFRFFIIDLHKQLQNLYKNYIELLRSYDLDYLTVYRGQQMSTEEFQKLKENIGELISINSFLSTTTDSAIAMIYAGNDANHPDIVSVLFQITIDLNMIDKNSERPFADVKEHTYFISEDEILFSMSTIFRIETVETTSDNNMWTVKLTFIHEDNAPMKQLYNHFTMQNNQHTTEADLGHLLFLMGDYDRAIDYCKLLLNENHESSSLNIDIVIECYNIIGLAYSQKSCDELALQYYEAAFETQLIYDSSNTTSLSTAYNNIGFIYRRFQSPNSLVRRYYEEAFQLQLDSLNPNYPLMATILNNMASLMDTIEESIETYLKVIEIREEYLPLAHPLIAATYSCLGQAYLEKGDTEKALKYFERTMDRQQQYLPGNHPSHIGCYTCLGLLNLRLGDKQKILHSNDQLARDYYKLSLNYYSKALDAALTDMNGNDREMTSILYNNMSVSYIRLEEYRNAFEHLTKAKIYQSHKYIGLWHRNMGHICAKVHDYDAALDHYKQALVLYEKTNEMPDFSIEVLYYNLGELYDTKKDYMNALINYEKALDIALMKLPHDNIYVIQYKKAIERVRSTMMDK